MRVPLVVVVDDDASVRRALTRHLLSADLRVLTYASATEFLDSGIGSAPDCVILDIHLGGMSELERLARLRESGHGLPIFHARDTPYPRWGLRAGRKKGEYDASPPRPLGSTKRDRAPDRRPARHSKFLSCTSCAIARSAQEGPDMAELVLDSSVDRWAGVLSSPIEGRVVLGPNWFASVMGTGIIAIAAAILPVKFPGLFVIASAAWMLAAVLLVALLVVIPVHWIRRRGTFTAIVDDPIAIQFFGAPPMALMTVGTATLLVGSAYIGQSAAIAVDSVLWVTGTALGLVTAVAVPYRLFTHLEVRSDAAFGGWLMPVVPPMVSAAGGALLVHHAPAGAFRESMLLVCYSLFGMSLVASLIVITLIWSRLVHFGSSGSARVPTLWIVLGPVGQSITAAGGLGAAATTAVAAPLATALDVFAVVFGVPMWGFIWLWLPIAALLTIRARRRQVGFALTWWSFTFPVGTCVTGTSQLALHTWLPMFEWATVALFACLLAAWVVVLVRTAKGSLQGVLLTPPLASPQPEAFKA